MSKSKGLEQLKLFTGEDQPPSQKLLKRVTSRLRRDARCTGCKLHSTTENVCILGTGSLSAKGVMISEAPGANEEEESEPFVGQSGQLLRRLMREVGIKDSDVYITNAVKCRPPNNRSPTKAEIRDCRPWLKYELNNIEPKVVLLMGATALLSVLGKTGIAKIRGQIIEHEGVFYLPTFHPAYALRDDRAIPHLKSDLKKFKAMIEGGGQPKIPGLDPRVIEDEESLAEAIAWINKQWILSFDCETSGLYAWKGHVVSLGIGNRDRQYILMIHHYLWNSTNAFVRKAISAIDDAIQARRKKIWLVGQNAKFDSIWMKVHYGVDWYADFDTMLAHFMTNENDRHGLDHQAITRYGALDYDVPLSVKQGLTGTVDQHVNYLALDILYTAMLAEDLEEELEQEPAVKKVFDKLLMPAARMFVDIELDGIYVDSDKFDEVEEYLRSQMHEKEIELSKFFPGTNWGSPQQVANILFNKLKLSPLDRTDSGAPSTSESVLKRLATQHEIPALLMKHREAKQQLSFFIEGWKPWLHRGRLHPSFKLHGTVTGRLSCENPNLQQVPRDPRIRSLLVAPPGWEFVEADLSQIELRIVAELSGDPEMMRCFLTGIDIHWLTALREIFRGGGYQKEIIETVCRATGRNQVDYEDCYDILLKLGPDTAIEFDPRKSDSWPGWKEIRKRAKAINFGYVYGMWWKKFIIYARDTYDVVISEKQAQESRESFFELYRLGKWHQRQKGFARKNGYVRSLFGRKRRLPRAMDVEDTPERGSAERQAVNSPVQSFASDLNLAAALELRRLHNRSYFRICGTVHDAILMIVRVDKLEEVVNDVLRVMKHPPLMDELGVSLRVPLEADVKIGSWSQGVSPEKYFARKKSA